MYYYHGNVSICSLARSRPSSSNDRARFRIACVARASICFSRSFVPRARARWLRPNARARRGHADAFEVGLVPVVDDDVVFVARAKLRASHARAGERRRCVGGARKKTRADVFESLKNQPLSGTKYKSTGAFQPTRVDDAKAQIVRFLEYKPRTRKELFDKLTIDKGYEAEDANEALDAMQRAGVQSDAAYAEAFARYKWRNSRWAAWRVRGALRQKGVDDRDIDLGFGPVFAEGGAIKIDLFEDDEDDDEDDEENLERMRAKELLQAARTQFKRNKRGDFQARVRRLMAWLERRGHGGSVIRDIVTVLKREEQYSDDDEDDNALHFDD